MYNPLISMSMLPEFSKINPQQVAPALDQVLADNRAQLNVLLQHKDKTNWSELAHPIEDMHVRVDKLWAVVSHLTHVKDSDPLREAYHACLPALTEYVSELKQNEILYQRYLQIKESPEYKALTKAQSKVIENAIRDFKLAGVNLSPESKQRIREIHAKLANITHKFEENVLDATEGWTRLVTDERELAGIPEVVIARAQEEAKNRNLQGWLLTLEAPCYLAVMTYADSQDLREEIYTAFVTRASDIGPCAKRWDNSQVMIDILNLRHEESILLGFKNYAELSLAIKMAKRTEDVIAFLQQLVKRSKPVAEKEWHQLVEFAQKNYGVKKLKPWDVTYYGEKLRQHKFTITQEELRPYFPEAKVLPGLFTIFERLFEVTIQEMRAYYDRPHEDVRFFEVRSKSGTLQGGFYLDLYARSHKRGGAWVDSCTDRHRFVDDTLQIPIAFINCNFNGPTKDSPALFTHEEIVTLFHEFGHGLHQMLTQVDCASVAGTNGVAWDAVEFPSQFMENWAWQKEALHLISGHYITHEPLPDDLLKHLHAAKNFQTGMQMVRQLEFALFDFRLHLEYDPKHPRIQELLDEVRAEVAVVPIAKFNRFQHGFGHIFGDGYAAGYYSYKWAEVLASDAFTKFEENGVFDQKTGREFLETILTQGGSQDAMDLYIAFRGREPKIDALLKHSGIEDEEAMY